MGRIVLTTALIALVLCFTTTARAEEEVARVPIDNKMLKETMGTPDNPQGKERLLLALAGVQTWRVTGFANFDLKGPADSLVRWEIEVPKGAEAIRDRLVFQAAKDEKGGKDWVIATPLYHGCVTWGDWSSRVGKSAYIGGLYLADKDDQGNILRLRRLKMDKAVALMKDDLALALAVKILLDEVQAGRPPITFVAKKLNDKAKLFFAGAGRGFPRQMVLPPGLRISAVRCWLTDKGAVGALVFDVVDAEGDLFDVTRQFGLPERCGGGGPIEFKLDPDERITKVSGHYDYILDELKFETNKGRSITFGKPLGQPKPFSVEGTELVGLRAQWVAH